MAEQRIVPLLVLAVTLMGTWAGLIATMPPNLISASTTTNYSKPSVPTQFSALDITQIAWFDNHTISPSNKANPVGTYGSVVVKFFLPPGAGAQIEAWVFWGMWDATPTLYLKHIWVTWGVFLQSHVITGMNNQGFGWDKTAILKGWDPNKNYSYIQGQCACGTIYFCYMTYNQTKYQSFGQAIDAYDIEMLIGVGIKDAVAKINAWNIIGALLIFQLPDINPLLNFFIALPFYAGIGVMIYVLILMAMPFVGG
ncbi:hypothetical protein MUP01_12720 [Candidatus Bathyarchaeota archaeon]|nr:hypothetical protein [Candidatus Bathyarchaeota archaeon]